MAKEVPVYLFVGFLESGKTTFIQETFEDPNFDSGDKTLLLVCEEGEVEYKPEKFAFPGTSIRVLEDKSELNAQNLANLEKETGAGRVIIEYNGMWLLQDLADALPPNWLIYQVIATADGTTALIKSVDITYDGKASGTTTVTCSYGAFKPLGTKLFPTDITLKMKSDAVKKAENLSVNISINNPDTDGDWDTFTSISSKYKQVSVQDVMNRLLKM